MQHIHVEHKKAGGIRTAFFMFFNNFVLIRECLCGIWDKRLEVTLSGISSRKYLRHIYHVEFVLRKFQRRPFSPFLQNRDPTLLNSDPTLLDRVPTLLNKDPTLVP